MLTELWIKNFKAWRDTGSIRLAPITVFFGSNSAGKTSLLQFLLMLKQTAESPDRRRVLHPGDEHTLVELGTYRDLVFHHEVENSIQFQIGWKIPEPLRVSDVLTRNTYGGDTVSFRAGISSDERAVRQHVDFFSYTLGDLNTPHGVKLSMTRKASDGGKTAYDLEASPYKLVRNQGRAWALPAPVRFYGFPEEVSAYYQNAGFSSDLSLELERQFKRILYLGPLRNRPSRSYTWSGEVPDHVGFSGERTVEAILSASDRMLSAGYKRRNRRFQDVIADWLKEMGLLSEFSAKPIAVNRKQYEVLVEAAGSREQTTLMDVGFGVSQVLPVIVQCFYPEKHSTVIIEQPELHLHPRVQASLADLFIHAAKAREAGENRSMQFLIESHSEHFLYRLQRRIAEGHVSADDVALYFCVPSRHGSVIMPLDLDDEGDIRNWPPDFFGDEMDDLRARLAAVAARRGVSVGE